MESRPDEITVGISYRFRSLSPYSAANATKLPESPLTSFAVGVACAAVLHGYIRNNAGLSIYTKGKLVQEAGVDTYYFLISSKRST
jgi:hypothetical protein